jgi:hypothetical protein
MPPAVVGPIAVPSLPLRWSWGGNPGGPVGAGAGQAAYQATFRSAGDFHARLEYGAFILQYQGKDLHGAPV